MGYQNVKFLHVVRLGKEEVDGFLDAPGDKYVFPKLDGTNAIVWCDDYMGEVHAGSRTRELMEFQADNAGFRQHALTSDKMKSIRDFCQHNPGKAVCGEWLGAKAHITGYLKREFWVFDVHDIVSDDDGSAHLGYHPYDEYAAWLADYPFVIPPLVTYKSGDIVTEDMLVAVMNDNHFNLPPDVVGEGIVIKNYDYRNRFGRYEEAKIVRDEFVESKGRKKVDEMPADGVEAKIVDEYVTPADVEKSKSKAEIQLGREFTTSDSKMIGMILEMTWRDLVEEEMYDIAKKYAKYPITFSMLKGQTFKKVKSVLGISR